MLARAPKTLTAVFSPANKVSKVSVDLGQGSVNAPVLSNNIVQLKFRTKDFTGVITIAICFLFINQDTSRDSLANRVAEGEVKITASGFRRTRRYLVLRMGF